MYQLSLRNVLILIGLFFVILPPTAFSRKKGNSWSGKYRQDTGLYNLIINQVETDLLEVDIVKVKNPEQLSKASFLADVKGNLAKMISIHDDPDCRFELKRIKEGIKISDFCGGTGDDVGLYRKVER